LARLFLRRLPDSLLLIGGVLTLVFLTMFVVGDPARAMLPPETPYEEYLAFRRAMGFDDPIPVQYLRFIGGVVRGDFGQSWWERTPALPIALRPLPATLLLAVFSLAVAVSTGLPLGVLASRHPGSALDRLAILISLSGVTMPIIWLGLIMILVFAVGLRWLPTSGYGTWAHVVLPGLTLAALPMGRIAQISRVSMIDELAKQYVVTATAKGLPGRAVLFRHALRNAAIPILTVAGWELVLMLGGYTIVVETVFGWPGVGLQLFTAIEHRDMPVIAATVFVISVVIVAVNFLVDLLYGAIDPRVQYQ